MKKQLLVFAASVCIGFVVKAQNFSGHYTQESKEMVDGKEYLNAIAQELTITQTKDSIKIVRVTPAGNDQTTTSTETLPLNGKQIIVTTSSKRKRVSFITIDKEKSTATITSTYSYADKPDEIEFKNTEVWDLDADGTLTITKTSDATVTDDWTIKAVFKKS
jgi:hypothetical protein